MTVSCQRHVGRPVVAPVEERADDDAPWARAAALSSSLRPSGSPKSVGEARPRPSRRRRRSPWRRGRAAAWPGCSAGPRRGPTGRGPGSRSAGRGRRRAGSRASRTRRPRCWATRVSTPSSSNRHSSTASATSENTREVGARAVVGRAQRVRPTRPDLDVVGQRVVSGLSERIVRARAPRDKVPEGTRLERGAPHPCRREPGCRPRHTALVTARRRPGPRRSRRRPDRC